MTFTKVLSIGCVVLGSLLPSVGLAHPFIESVSPPVLQRGKTNRIELFGRELNQALDLWTSVPSIRLTAKPVGSNDAEHAGFEVSVPANAPLGMYGLRIATRSGLSNVHIFLIDELPVTQRADLPGDANQPRSVPLPICVTAPCREAAIDRYQIDVQAGQRVSFEVIGNRFGKDYDPLVSIRDRAGRLLAEHDTDVGLYCDCRFEHRFPLAGAYVVEVRDARYAGHSTWKYVLRMGDFPAARVAVPSSLTPGKSVSATLPELTGSKITLGLPANQPSGWLFQDVRSQPKGIATWIAFHADSFANAVETEPNNDSEHATTITVPATLHGVLQSRGDRDWFRFELKKGQTINVASDATNLGSAADLELVMVDKTGRELRRVDEVTIRNGRETTVLDARFSFSANADGLYDLQVGDMARGGGSAFAYRVEITGNEPRLAVHCEVTRVTVPQGNYQPIPIKVTRTRLSGPVELSLLGAPAGVTLEPTTIPADQTEVICKLKAANTTVQGLSTIQIRGRWKSEDEKVDASAEALATTQPLIDKRIRNKDLQTFALREDQRRLPPSLTNRLAVMITPPAPFDVQLPNETVLMAKYQQASFPIATTRTAGFAASISFTATGGQIGDEAEERSNVFVRFPLATKDRPNIDAMFYNRILASYARARIDLSAAAEFQGHQVTLNRTFQLELKSAFNPTFEPATIEVEPGKTVKFRILANRTPTYDGSVTLKSSPFPGFKYPETVEIPAGQPHVDVEVTANPETTPRRYQLRYISRGYIGKYEEEVRGPNVSITVKKPPAQPAAKKK